MTRFEVTIGPGPTTASVDGHPCPFSPTETRIVAALALFHPDPVDATELRSLLWGTNPPPTARTSLRNHLSRLRRRNPNLIGHVPGGYVLADDVAVLVVSSGGSRSGDALATGPVVVGRFCPELIDSDWVDQRRWLLEQRTRAEERARVDRRLVTDDPSASLTELRSATERDAFDERAWFGLVAATAAALGRDAALSVADEATRALATCGLEPGRRLRDLERLVRDGERNLERLMTDRSGANGPPPHSLVAPAATLVLASDVLAHLDDDRPTHVRVRGPRRSGRSALVDLIAVRARGAGVSVRTMVGAEFAGLPMPVVGDWLPRRRRLLVIDDIDHLEAASHRSLESVVADAVAAASDAGIPFLVVSSATEPVTASPPVPSLMSEAFVNIEVELRPAQSDVAATLGGRAGGPVTPPAALPSAARDVLRVLALAELPVHVADLAMLLPDADETVRSMSRAGWIRDRLGDGRLSISDAGLRASLVGALTTDELSELHHRLAVGAFAADEPTVRVRRLARHALGAVQLDRAGAVAALECAGEQARSSFDHHAAAILFERAAAEADEFDAQRSLSAQIAAGRARLAAGDVTGLDLLETVADQSLALELPVPAALATHAFCRLGPVSTSGVVDGRAARLVRRVMPQLSSPRDRALVGAVATMVHVLADDVEHCRQLFDEAVVAAEQSGDDDVLAEVLPFAYLSRAAPEDLELRERVADRLLQVADRLDRADSRWEALHLRFSNELQRGDPGVRSTAQKLALAADESRETVRDWEMAYVRAAVAHLDGRLVDAEDEITASLTLSGAVGSNRAMAVYGSVLLACRLDEDRVDELSPSIEAIAADQPLVLAWQAPLALAAATTGDVDRAAEAVDRLVGGADRLPRECNYTAALVMLGEATARLGCIERAARAVELLEPWSGRWAWTGTCSFGPIDFTLARLAESTGDRSAARRWGTAALRSAAMMRAPVLAERCARLVLRQR